MIEFFPDLAVENVELAFTVTWQKGNKRMIRNRSSFGITFAKKGALAYIMDGEEIVSDQHHAVLLPKHRTYTIVCRESGSFPVINFQCDTAPFRKILRFPIEDTASYISDCAKLEKLLNQKHRENPYRSMAVLYNIFARLYDTAAYSNARFRILEPAIQYMEANIASPDLANAELAKRANISVVYFRKLFKERYGIPPKQYIQSLRIERAKELLETGLFSVTEVAKKTGYSDIYHFSRAFSQAAGCSPTRYATRNSLPE